jgi:hypothetical protein
LGTVGWLLRTWIETRFKAAIDLEYEKKIETFKAELNRQHETLVEHHLDAALHRLVVLDALLLGQLVDACADDPVNGSISNQEFRCGRASSAS